VSFTQAIFLLGVVGLAGPIVAHLLARPKYKRLSFTMLGFLHAGQRETKARRSLRNLLILLLRCLIIVLLAMLFARPLILSQVTSQEQQKVYYLGLDNSLSMAYAESGQSYFARMIDLSDDYIKEGADDGVFSIHELASGLSRGGLNKQQALNYLRQIKVVPVPADVSRFVAAAKDSQNNDGESSVLLVSDFTPAFLAPWADLNDNIVLDDFAYEVIASDKPIDNAAITQARVCVLAEDKLQISATVVNYGHVRQKRSLQAKISNSSNVVGKEIEVGSNEHRTITIELPIETARNEAEFIPVELALSEGDGLKEDDSYYLAVTVPQQKSTNVLLTGQSRGELFLLKTALEMRTTTDDAKKLNVREMTEREYNRPAVNWAQVIICAGMGGVVNEALDELETFVKMGGKLIIFVTEEMDKAAIEQLWQTGLLAARPGKFYEEPSYIARRDVVAFTGDALDPQGEAIATLLNYRIDKVVLKGFYETEPTEKSVCLWRLQNGNGFIYFKHAGNGATILVNTSADDSLGTLTKWAGVVAFGRYLLGQDEQVAQYSFACGEAVALPASELEIKCAEQQNVWVKTPSAQQSKATVADSFLWAQPVGQIGWLRTMSRPIRYAGINAVPGETNMTRPNQKKVKQLTAKVFSKRLKREVTIAGVLANEKYRSIEKILAWILVGMVVAEAFVTNRVKR